MTRKEKALREAIVAKARWMNASGLNQGTSGNISARYNDVMLITPSATAYDAMTPQTIAAMPLDGEYGSWTGPLKPSTEWRFHLNIMKSRPDVGAVAHTHSNQRDRAQHRPEGNPGLPLHDGGVRRYDDLAVRITRATAPKELADHALKALEGRNGRPFLPPITA